MILQFYRRIFIVVLACCVLCTGVVGAAASSYSPGYELSYDILSIATADGDNHVTVGSSVTLGFNLPYVLTGDYVDMVVSTVGGNITEAHAGIAGGTRALTVTQISNGLFRIYGSVGTRTFQQIRVVLKSDSTSTQADFVSFRLFKSGLNIHETLGRISFYDLVNEGHYGQTSYGEVLTCGFAWDTGDNEISIANVLLTCPTWQKYDYVEFMVYGKFSSVDAIIARVDDVSVPFSVTLLDGSGDVYSSHSDNTWRNMVISVDVRDVIRSNTPEEDLRLRIDMNLSYYLGSQAVFYLSTVNGIVDSGTTVSENFWWTRVISAISTGCSNVVSAVQSMSSAIVTELQSGFPSVVTGLESVGKAVNNLTTGFTQWVKSNWTGFVSNWNTTMSGLRSSVESWFQTIDNNLTSLWTNISSRWDSFQAWLQETFDPDSSDINNAGEQIGDDVDSIEKVEQDIMVDFDANAHIVTEAFNIASFASAFAFVGSILSGVWSGLGGYQVVFTLPIALGIVLYVCNRLPGVSRPSRRVSPDPHGGSEIGSKSASYRK